MKILIVDDNAMVRELLSRIADTAGHEPAQAGDGREALDTLRREPFDLVLMDVLMPGMDGLEATRAIRGGAAPAVPIVGMTASEGLRKRCLKAGMDDFATKPLSMRRLLDLIDRYDPVLQAC